jgi:hypothetical protein
MKKQNNTNLPDRQEENEEKDNLQGYPLYLQSEDIYSKYKKGKEIINEDISMNKGSNEKRSAGTNNEKDFNDDLSGSDLDIPGSELDDELESIGSEDEENNYYSLGGDNHNNLDEDIG